MTILFVGTDIGDFVQSGVVMTTNYVDAAYQTATMETIGADYLEKSFTAIDALWLAAYADIGVNNYIAGNTPIQIFKGTTPVLRMIVVSTQVFRLEYWNGTAWATAIPDFAADFVTENRYAVYARAGTTGEIRLYKNEVRVGVFQGDTSALVGMDRFQLAGVSSNYGTYWAEVLLATHPIVTARVKTHKPAAAGAYAEMTGTVADINEAIANDTTALISGTALQRSTFTINALPANVLVPTLVSLKLRGKRGTTGPQGLSALLRSGTTDHATNVTMLDDVTFEQRVVQYTTNPVTAAAWTRAEVDALQVGVRSET